MLSAKQGHIWNHLYEVFGVTRPGIKPRNSLCGNKTAGTQNTYTIPVEDQGFDLRWGWTLSPGKGG